MNINITNTTAMLEDSKPTSWRELSAGQWVGKRTILSYRDISAGQRRAKNAILSQFKISAGQRV